LIVTNVESLGGELIAQTPHRRHLVTTRLAPRRPEVEEDGLATIVGE
jgi:hypothetical protein